MPQNPSLMIFLHPCFFVWEIPSFIEAPFLFILMTDISMTLLDRVEMDRDRRITRARSDLLKKSITDSIDAFDIEHEVKEIKGNNVTWLQVKLRGEDAVAAANFLKLKHGAKVMLFDVQEGTTIQRAKADASGSTGFGMFFDIGLENKHALYPLYRMRDQLTNGKKIPARKLAKMFGFCDGFGFPVLVTEVDEQSKIFVELDARVVDEFATWRDDALDRVLCHGETKEGIERVITSSGAKKEHIMVQEAGFLDCIITCDSRTEGAGIISLIGPALSHVKFAVFKAAEVNKALA